MTPSQASTGKALFKRRLADARLGDPQAQVEVGSLYANGVGTRRNADEALSWFRAAAAKGHPAAQYLVAIAHASGMGTEKDEFQAVQWLFRAAEQGHDKALLKLARRVTEHHGELAFHCCLKAATLGLGQAQFELAEHYALGIGVPADQAAARNWYERAARQGVVPAQFALARLIERTAAGPPPDEALRWYRAASAQGHPGAQLALARLDDAGVGRSSDTRRRGRRGEADERRHPDDRWARYAEGGEAADRHDLGRMHEAGIGVEADRDEACRWYRLAAEQQHRDAQVALARLCQRAAEEEGDEAAADEAFHWWQQAAELGSAEAQHALGRRHAAEGAHHDPLQALAWQLQAARQGHPEALMAVHAVLSGGAAPAADQCLREAAERGHAQAQFAMGQRFATGEGVARSPDLARQWLERAAGQGHADAQCALGDWYAAGHGVPDFVDPAEREAWRAAGHGVAPDFVQARGWYEQAARQGHVRAQWLLGGLYATGAVGVPRDGRQAASWCKKAAEAGFAPAQATLGTLFAQAKKMDRAVPWWSKAAVQGDPEAQFNLANAYRSGRGVEADPRTAFLLWSNAAAAGVAAAQTRLGLAYAQGEGAALDPIEAAKWFIVAERAGDAAAAANRQHAATLLSPVQLAEAQWRAHEWIRQSERLRELPPGTGGQAGPAAGP